MNVEIGADAAQFPEKEYIIGIAVAVQPTIWLSCISLWGLESGNELTMKFCSARISLYTLRIIFCSIMYLSIYYAGRQAVIFLIKLSSKFSQDRKV